MSKLYKRYIMLKVENSECLYLFKSGIFYIFLDEDARIMSSKLNLKLTNLNSSIVKCGFPTSQLTKYLNLINSLDFKIRIIDSNNLISYSVEDYLNNEKIENLLNYISKIDCSNLSISQAYECLEYIVKQSNSITNEFQAKEPDCCNGTSN